MGEDIGDALLGKNALIVARKIRKALKEPLYLCLSLETTARISLEGLTNYGGKRFLWNQHLAPALDRLITVSDGCNMDPVARLHAGFHFLRDLPPVLFALKCALGRHDRLNKFAFRRIIKFEVQTFNLSAASAKGFPQIEVEPRITGKAFEIVENDDKALIGLCVDKTKQRHHAGPLHKITAAGYGVRKDGGNVIAFLSGMLTASCFLRFQTVTVLFLRSGRHATVYYGFLNALVFWGW